MHIDTTDAGAIAGAAGIDILGEDAHAAVCSTCGTQFSPGQRPEICLICLDDRQYVPPGGQEWTSMAELKEEGRSIELRSLEENLYGISVEPSLAIGHRALIIRTPVGNIMWDAIPLVNEETIEKIRDLGGIRAIAASHPHFYTGMVTWSRVLDNAPIHLPESSRPWVQRGSANIKNYPGDEKTLFGGVSLHRTGGHFDCSQVALWKDGAEGRGVLMSTDEPAVTPGLDRVSFMYSFPNNIPLDRFRLTRVLSILKPLKFDRIYAGWWDKMVANGAKAVVQRSAVSYLKSFEFSDDSISHKQSGEEIR